MKTVIILNAPPFSGKDTIANLFIEHIKPSKKMEFKDALYKAFTAYYGITMEETKLICTHRLMKDTHNSSFFHANKITPREGLIHVSEDIFKPYHGADYFGIKAAEKLELGSNVFSDGGGWEEELKPVAEAADKVLIVRMHRNGYNFNGDSRNYYKDSVVNMPNTNIQVFDLQLEEDNPMAALDAILNKLK
ncbi:MAG: hypothetical protein HRT61_00560 [Ekhidna sp.]|nr:hypothetical protein [Ekhidna sp.]